MATDNASNQAITSIKQYHTFPYTAEPAPGGKHRWYRITITGGRGGHAPENLDKGRASAVVLTWGILAGIYNDYDFDLSSIRVGSADDTIASEAEIIICVPSGEASEFVKSQLEPFNEWIQEEYHAADPDVHCMIEKIDKQNTIIPAETFEAMMNALEQVPQGKLQPSGEGTADNSESEATTGSPIYNNVGRILADGEKLLVSTITYCDDKEQMQSQIDDIALAFAEVGGTSEVQA
jgi:dipeptidase D